MKIVRIEKKGTSKVELVFDDGQILILSYEIFLKNGLRKNDDVSESHFLFLNKENEKYLIKQKAYNYLARRLHSEKELKLKLLKGKFDKELIDEVIGVMNSSNYLDDEEFAREFINEKKKKSWGSNKNKAGLISKGISREIISNVLDEEIDEDVQYKKAYELAQKKLRSLSYKNIDKAKLKQKINTSLISKGFSFDIVRRVFEDIDLEENVD